MSKTLITAEPGMPQIIITREFDAPRDLVFRAHTDPGLLGQWLGLARHPSGRRSEGARALTPRRQASGYSALGTAPFAAQVGPCRGKKTRATRAWFHSDRSAGGMQVRSL